MNQEALKKGPLYVVDFLPEQVPEGSRGQFFAVEAYYLQVTENWSIYDAFLRILLKLNCYYDFDVQGKKRLKHNPDPEKLERWVLALSDGERERLTIFLNGGKSLLELQRNSLCMGVFCPDEHLKGLLARLAAAEGLYFWQNENWNGADDAFASEEESID